MKISNRKNKNGLRVVCAETPHLNKASFTLLVKAGSVYESKKHGGIFHLIEHGVFGGSEKYKDSEGIEHILEKLGVIEQVATDKEFTKYNMSFHSKDTLAVLDLLLDILNTPKFPNNFIREEKKIIAEEIETDKNDTFKIFYTKALKSLFQKTPLSQNIAGTKNSIKNITALEMKRAHRQFYRPDNMILAYAGSFSVLKVRKKSEEYFLRKQKTRAPSYPDFALPEKTKFQEKYFKIQNDFQFLSFSFIVPYKQNGDEDLAYLLKYIINKKVKELLITKEQISYDVEVNLNEFNNFGVLDINSSFNDRTKTKLIEILKNFFSNFPEITKQEIKNAQTKASNMIDFTLDDPALFSEYLAYNGIEGDCRTPSQENDALNKVSLQKINRFANTLFNDQGGTLFVSNGKTSHT